jgi:hypothetical protein
MATDVNLATLKWQRLHWVGGDRVSQFCNQTAKGVPFRADEIFTGKKRGRQLYSLANNNGALWTTCIIFF